MMIMRRRKMRKGEQEKKMNTWSHFLSAHIFFIFFFTRSEKQTKDIFSENAQVFFFFKNMERKIEKINIKNMYFLRYVKKDRKEMLDSRLAFGNRELKSFRRSVINVFFVSVCFEVCQCSYLNIYMQYAVYPPVCL